MERLALLLGACATLTTLVGWGAALTAAREDPPTSAPAPASGPWQVVQRPGGRFAVPPRVAGWSVAGPREVIYYADPRGVPAVGVTGPAVLDAGYCDRTRGPSNRAFVGLTAPVRGRPGPVNARLARAWTAAVAGREPTAVRPERPEWTVLADGTPAVRAHAVLPVPRGPCRPARVSLDLVSADAGRSVVTLVLVRDLGAGTLPAPVAERILGSLAAG